VGLGAGIFTWALVSVSKLAAVNAIIKKIFMMVIYANVMKVKGNLYRYSSKSDKFLIISGYYDWTAYNIGSFKNVYILKRHLDFPNLEP
jgi:hypothetical protein